MDPLLSSLMQQATLKCETAQLELNSSWTFLAIKHCQQTKIREVIKLVAQSSAPMGGFLITAPKLCCGRVSQLGTLPSFFHNEMCYWTTMTMTMAEMMARGQ
jgi:hypothetical protein